MLEQNIKILNKNGISITDFSFCLRLPYSLARQLLMLPLQNFDILFIMNFCLDFDFFKYCIEILILIIESFGPYKSCT